MSTPTVSFGFTLPQRGILFGVTTVPELMASATEADSSGLFDSIWVGDSLFAKPRPNSLALLGALTALTKKVTIGVGCMLLSFITWLSSILDRIVILTHENAKDMVILKSSL